MSDLPSARRLAVCRLFRDMSLEDIERVLSRTSLPFGVETAHKSDVLMLEGDRLTHIGILLAGVASVQRTLPSGEPAVMGRLSEGDTFAEALLFARDAKVPASVIAMGDVEYIRISKEGVAAMCGDKAFLLNYMGVLSERILRLQRRVTMLSYQTLRQRIAAMLLRETRAARDAPVELGMGRQEMADMMGTARPSLSRELSRMAKLGWIAVEGRSIVVRDRQALAECLRSADRDADRAKHDA